MIPYIMYHVHTGRSSLTCLERHCVGRTDTHELTFSALETPSSIMPWGVYYIQNNIFLINALLSAPLAFTTGLANTVHIHATHVILVMGVNELTIFINVFNQKRVLPPGHDSCRICNP